MGYANGQDKVLTPSIVRLHIDGRTCYLKTAGKLTHKISEAHVYSCEGTARKAFRFFENTIDDCDRVEREVVSYPPLGG